MSVFALYFIDPFAVFSQYMKEQTAGLLKLLCSTSFTKYFIFNLNVGDSNTSLKCSFKYTMASNNSCSPPP